jgi:hypothetical protein
MIQISLPKATEIIILALEKSNYYFNTVEKYLLKTGVLEDVGLSDTVFNAVKNANNDLLEHLIELI